MKVHERIKNIRVVNGFTQEYMAEKLGLATENYGRIERGLSKITVDRLLIIASLLNVPVSVLIDGHTPEKQHNCAMTCLDKNDILKLMNSNMEMNKLVFDEIKKINECWKSLYEEVKKNKK